jgi:SNF2 family DNA or RNA helicase
MKGRRAVTYRSAHESWHHQAEALSVCHGKENFALQMAMRTGKTKVVLDDFGMLVDEGRCYDLLVIAPGGVYRTWEEAIREHVGEGLKGDLGVHIWKSGGGKRNAQSLENFMAYRGPRILVMNIEALSSVKAARETALEFVGLRLSMTVIDESTTIKNFKSKRTKFLNRELAGETNFRRILTGCISPKSPLDVYTQYEFLDWGILGFKSFFAFRARYANLKTLYLGRRSIQVVDSYKNLEELQAKLAPATFRRTLDQCYDLPPKMYLKRHVTMTDEQERLYNAMRDEMRGMLETGEHINATIVITQMLRLHQILCGWTVDENDNHHAVPSNRVNTLLEVLEETEGKVIIWVSYDEDVYQVSSALTDNFQNTNTIARFWGGNRDTREAEERKFKTDPNCRYMIATPAAGGMGRTWDVADTVIYYSNTYNLEHRIQSEERPQKVGKMNSVLYVDLMVPDTVDEVIVKALRGKLDLYAMVTGESLKEWLI